MNVYVCRLPGHFNHILTGCLQLQSGKTTQKRYIHTWMILDESDVDRSGSLSNHTDQCLMEEEGEKQVMNHSFSTNLCLASSSNLRAVTDI